MTAITETSAGPEARRPPWRRLIGPGVMTLVMLAILVGLGTWQVQRLAWKTAILDRIAAAESAPAVKLPAHPSPFQKVEVEGRFDNARTARFGAAVRDSPEGPVMGSDLIVPLQRPGAAPILVDRGWAPGAPHEAIEQPAGTVHVDGYIRAPEKSGPFTPRNDAAARQFFTLDPEAIGAALGLPQVAPFVLVAMGPERPGVFPAPAQHLPRPPNNHLSYALTWYGLAVVLLVIFGQWAFKVLRDDTSHRV